MADENTEIDINSFTERTNSNSVDNGQDNTSFLEDFTERPAVITMDGAEEIPGYLEQITNNYAERQKQVQKSIEDHKAGKMDTNTGIEWLDSLAGDAQFKIQGIGKGIAGTVLDTIGVGVGATIDGISWVIPDMVEDPIKEQIGNAWDWTMNTEGGRAAQEAFAAGGKVYEKWKEENPQYAKTFEAIVLTGLVVSPAKGTPRRLSKPVEGPMLKTEQNILNRASERAVIAGFRQSEKERFESIRALLAPAIDKDSIKKRGPEGQSAIIPATTFKDAVLKPAASDIPVIEHIASLKNINPKKGALDAIIKVQSLQAKLDDEIAKILRSKQVGAKPNLVYIPNSAIDFRIKTNLDAIKNTPALKSQKQIQDLFDLYSKEASKIMKKHDNSPLGYHNARIEWDKFIQTEVGGKALDAATPGLRSEIARQIRNAINSGVDDLVPHNSVKSRRTQQNLNYRAIDMLAPKGVLEVEKAIGRTYQNVWRVSKAKTVVAGTIGTAAALAGYSLYSGAVGKAALITAAALAGPITLGFAGHYIKKGAMSAKAKTNYGKFISHIDRAIKDTKNPDMRFSLRKNRVIIASLLNMPTENVDAQGNPL
jgi:hypothetical protein